MDCAASKYNAEVHLNEAHDKGSTITRGQRLPQSVVLLPRQRSIFEHLEVYIPFDRMMAQHEQFMKFI